MHDVIIIGSGPAGLTAGLYMGRAKMKPLMIEGVVKAPNGMMAGGQLMLTTEVENYPGFPEGIEGPHLIDRMKQQALRFGMTVVSEDVTKVDFSQRPFKVYVGDEVYLGKTVIIATGARSRMLGLEAEQRLFNKGVSTCATCDGAFFQDQVISVVGGGDSAMEEALFLTRYGTKVNVIHRRDEFRASKIMADRVIHHPKIQVYWDSAIEDILAKPVDGPLEELVSGLRLRNLKTEKISEIETNAVFIAIGHIPNTDLFEGILELHPNGYIKTKHDVETTVEGVFACGDVQDFTYRQAITAAGSGCMAAIRAERWLENQHSA
jgi:thioredoxin reductase (NADPH)